MFTKVLISVSLSGVLAARAAANDIGYQATTTPLAYGATGSLQFPQLDPSLGVLRSVDVILGGNVTGTWAVENTNATPSGISSQTNYIGSYIPNTFPGGFGQVPNPAFLPYPDVPLAAFDGTLDFAGPSAAVMTFVNANDGGGLGYFLTTVNQPVVLPSYVGTGNVTFGFGPIGQQGPVAPLGIQSTFTVTTTATVYLTYHFDPLPAHVCDSLGYFPCPCNPGPPNANAGCTNSTGMGGVLDAGGTASLSADTLVLSGSSMTSSSALYFQGTTNSYQGAFYGDGTRCVGGSVVRLGTKNNVAGSSQYPAPGDLPVSVRGGVTSPGLRYYQVLYRDNGNYCTTSSFNLTSGMAVLWNP